jgi:hypothetical protein
MERKFRERKPEKREPEPRVRSRSRPADASAGPMPFIIGGLFLGIVGLGVILISRQAPRIKESVAQARGASEKSPTASASDRPVDKPAASPSALFVAAKPEPAEAPAPQAPAKSDSKPPPPPAAKPSGESDEELQNEVDDSIPPPREGMSRPEPRAAPRPERPKPENPAPVSPAPRPSPKPDPKPAPKPGSPEEAIAEGIVNTEFGAAVALQAIINAEKKGELEKVISDAEKRIYAEWMASGEFTTPAEKATAKKLARRLAENNVAIALRMAKTGRAKGISAVKIMAGIKAFQEKCAGDLVRKPSDEEIDAEVAKL